MSAPASGQPTDVRGGAGGGHNSTKDPQTPCLGSLTPEQLETLPPENLAGKDVDNVHDALVPREGVVPDRMALRKDVTSLKRDASSIITDLGLLFQQVGSPFVKRLS